MDETGFIQKKNLRKVFVIKGYSNVWSKCDDANFHMTFVVFFFADKSVVLPLLILPGKRLNNDVLGGCDIEGDNITTAPTVFIDSTFFKTVLDSLLTLFLVQLRAHLYWFIMAVESITMMILLKKQLILKSYWFYFQIMPPI